MTEKLTLKLLEILGHHLFCLRNFEGKGYNQIFIDNMYEIITKFNTRNQSY
ncbi:hypothetical protein [Natranaerobius trueperi]|uniref:hypothetical protein n=1 Tax=Natranaerobius trueperi TaxID=759412 RepID=UPI001303CD8E|nr:hypothetical protein [Natranaerobius trueperi]